MVMEWQTFPGSRHLSPGPRSQQNLSILPFVCVDAVLDVIILHFLSVSVPVRLLQVDIGST